MAGANHFFCLAIVTRPRGYHYSMDNSAITRLDHFTSVVSIPLEGGTGYRSYQLAGSGARVLAGLVDFLIQSASFALMAWVALSNRPDLFPRASWPWAGPVAFIEWHIIYLMLFESFTRGTTPGKRLCRLQVVMADGERPRPVALVVRNVARVIDLLAGFYAAAFTLISTLGARQRIGDRIAKTLVIYSEPLARQLYDAEVPESIYSTSEDGYLLESWVDRERRFDADSRIASGTDLAAYLHTKYDPESKELPDPATYLRQLYQAEHEHSQQPEGENV